MDKDKMITEELDRLQERYFEAQCTEQEEERLRKLLTLPEALDGRYDGLRAVMSYAAMGRRQEQARYDTGSLRPARHWPRRLAVAAAIVGVVMGALLLVQHMMDLPAETESVCYAHIHGEYVTDQEQVQQQMDEALAQMFSELKMEN